MSSYFYIKIFGKKNNEKFKELDNFCIGSSSSIGYILDNYVPIINKEFDNSLMRFKSSDKQTFEYYGCFQLNEESFDFVEDQFYTFLRQTTEKLYRRNNITESLDYLKLSDKEKENVLSSFCEDEGDLCSYKSDIYEIHKMKAIINMCDKFHYDVDEIVYVLYNSSNYRKVEE